jgi:enoyl-CoA hydratase/carnithine racemase
MASRCSALVTTTIIAHAHHHQKKALIARVTLNNVKKRNALSYTMLKELQTHLTKTELDPDIHVIILNANGPVFSSGHDLHELQQQQQQQQQKQQQDDENADHDANFATTNRMNIIHNNNTSTTDLMDLCSSVMQTITQMTKPVIAQVDGIATAAGCQLVASCDLAYASNNAQFATPGVNIGLFCSTPAVALSRTIHTKHAMHMLLTGDMISAKEAERIGLINAVVVDDDDDDKNNNLDEVVLDVAMKIASKSSTSIGIGKPIFYKQLGMSLDDAYKLTSNVMVENMKHDDAVEGIDAFLTKRIPNWSTFTFATTTATTTSKPNNSKSSSNIPFEK